MSGYARTVRRHRRLRFKEGPTHGFPPTGVPVRYVRGWHSRNRMRTESEKWAGDGYDHQRVRMAAERRERRKPR